MRRIVRHTAASVTTRSLHLAVRGVARPSWRDSSVPWGRSGIRSVSVARYVYILDERVDSICFPVGVWGHLSKRWLFWFRRWTSLRDPLSCSERDSVCSMPETCHRSVSVHTLYSWLFLPTIKMTKSNPQEPICKRLIQYLNLFFLPYYKFTSAKNNQLYVRVSHDVWPLHAQYTSYIPCVYVFLQGNASVPWERNSIPITLHVPSAWNFWIKAHSRNTEIMLIVSHVILSCLDRCRTV